MNLPPLILASASPRRSELLRQIAPEFEVIPSAAEELHDESLPAPELCMLNAARKARAVAERHVNALVVGADTLVYMDRKLFGKPADLADARRMLSELQGGAHRVTTGICLLQLATGKEQAFAEVTEVVFRPLTAAQIDRYLACIDPLDKAGAYAIQEHGEQIVETISGSYSNVVGLPLERLSEVLNAWLGG